MNYSYSNVHECDQYQYCLWGYFDETLVHYLNFSKKPTKTYKLELSD